MRPSKSKLIDTRPWNHKGSSAVLILVMNALCWGCLANQAVREVSFETADERIEVVTHAYDHSRESRINIMHHLRVVEETHSRAPLGLP